MTENPLGALCQVVVPVSDLGAAVTHFQRELDLTLEFQDGDRWAAFDAGGLTLALAAGDERPAGADLHLAIKVTDLEEAIARVTETGGSVVGTPSEGPHERKVEAVDRFGVPLLLYQPLVSG